MYGAQSPQLQPSTTVLGSWTCAEDRQASRRESPASVRLGRRYQKERESTCDRSPDRHATARRGGSASTAPPLHMGHPLLASGLFRPMMRHWLAANARVQFWRSHAASNRRRCRESGPLSALVRRWLPRAAVAPYGVAFPRGPVEPWLAPSGRTAVATVVEPFGSWSRVAVKPHRQV